MSGTRHTGTILVFDPDPVSLTGIAAVLHGQGHECYCARTSAAAIKAAEQALDVAVLEVDESVAAALSLLSEMRQHAQSAEIPAVLLTDASLVNPPQPTGSLAGVTFLTKPYDPNALVHLVEQALWMPYLVGGHRRRGSRPSRADWIRL